MQHESHELSPVDALAAIQNEEISHLYANGLISGMTNTDIVVVLLRNGQPICTVNMSLSLAKTMAIQLNNLVIELEKASGNRIMTADDITKAKAASDR